ncbi:hypothetical protein GJU39_05615 [Pedobacter petrophilus]|uniref:Uncharacterized protein n=1 Tax=Pedobacter petrophilus TaxID=1908241 RepID=A0A7K0FW29_9SPHI|nr:DUF6660 family protein [Pedobacter petrophilus]MRX75562.1 hypothetical protein [Pedobacter petrophilus]
MKILVYFLSFSILLLSCITCEDRLDIAQTEGLKLAVVKVSKTKAAPDNDNCSPLCTCNCCGQPVVSINNNTASSFLKLISSDNLKSGYQSRNVTEFSRNIWQPPKLNTGNIG